ncbi:MAG: trypsin-like serine protease [Chloroflexota bacterium]
MTPDTKIRPSEATMQIPKPDGPAKSILDTLHEPDFLSESGILGTGEVNPYSQYPYSAVGKIFFRQSDGYGNVQNYVCSGSVISNNEIWTAGHCAHSGNGLSTGWSTDMVFVPQYYEGQAPCGQWTISQLKVSRDWYESKVFNTFGNDHDYAKGLINNPNTGCTGTLGFAFNQDYNQQYLSIGYPAADPYTGQRMIFCHEPLLKMGRGTPTTFGISCPMNGGASGGPFLINGNTLNGNNSYIIPGANELYSPYFDSDAWDFFVSTF